MHNSSDKENTFQRHPQVPEVQRKRVKLFQDIRKGHSTKQIMKISILLAPLDTHLSPERALSPEPPQAHPPTSQGLRAAQPPHSEVTCMGPRPSHPSDRALSLFPTPLIPPTHMQIRHIRLRPPAEDRQDQTASLLVPLPPSWPSQHLLSPASSLVPTDNSQPRSLSRAQYLPAQGCHCSPQWGHGPWRGYAVPWSGPIISLASSLPLVARQPPHWPLAPEYLLAAAP